MFGEIMFFHEVIIARHGEIGNRSNYLEDYISDDIDMPEDMRVRLTRHKRKAEQSVNYALLG